ncbi:MAG: asparagine synthase (glutamine-hydrolyzing) [Proteobacteria bacterium]|nr:asparagine synthase (glutamine-hydrolyzing) [Pseudomonadota bacterium]
MCGIAGIMTRDGSTPPTAALEAMAAALRHRGPDGGGRHLAPGLGMVQRRLAIIDLKTGDQPLAEPGGAALIANAEVYNYVELRGRELAGVTLATASDCEPPLHLFRRQGDSYAAHLRGMYAIAIHDRASGRLLLSRDPFGIKPLYYAETGGAFGFASEPQALIAAGLVAPRVDTRARDELFRLQFVTGAKTLFAGIRRVLPGETLIVERGRIVGRRRLAALPDGPPEETGEEEALARLDAALADSVLVHQRSDVPYGMFLSGGTDSSAVLAMMARLNERPVRAFTVGFPGAAVADERAHARAVARAAGAEHVEVAFTEADFWVLLPEVAAALDDGVADYAVLPTYRLAREAGRGLKVILSGEGGDELFAGYGRYRRAMRPWWLGGRRMRRRGALDGLGLLRDEGAGWREGLDAAEAEAAAGGRTRLQAAQAADCADWLPHDLLLKLDRCLMAHGVEGRTPFLDPAVAGAVFRLPDRLKVRRGLGKWILRRWLARNLPEAEPFTAKRGFTVPAGEWIAGRGGALAPLVARQPGIAEACRPGAVEAVFRAGGARAGFAGWVLLFYALWHRRHVLGRAPAGDALETLSQSP